MKVYVVMGGWCDDTWVRFVCANEEKAKQLCEVLDPDDPNTTVYWVDEREIIQ